MSDSLYTVDKLSFDESLSELSSRSVESKTQFTHGLHGTNQLGNYFFINLLVAFFAIVGGILILIRLFRLGENHLRHVTCTGSSAESQDYWKRNKSTIFPWIKRYVLYAPLWSKRHNREWRFSKAYNVGTLPSRLHSIALVLYFLSNVAYCFVLDYNVEKAAIFAELRGRTGALATYNLIPATLFALRNNPLIPLLRVSYDTFNLLHRGVARIVIAESVGHVVCWMINTVQIKGWSALSHSVVGHLFIEWGLASTVLFVAMGIFAWSPFRHAFYETFLNTHRLMALFGSIGVYKHLEIGHLPQVPYMQLVFAFWVLELVMRIIRLFWWNVTHRHQTRVLVEALPKDACRLTFDLVRHWKAPAGSHVQVYIPRLSWHSSHPFSIAWTKDIDTPRANDEEKAADTIVLSNSLDAEHDIKTSISCIVRAESGMTKALFNMAANTPNCFISLRAFVEGPYGGHESLNSYGTVLLFCGGVGITHQLPFVKELVYGFNKGTVAAKKLVLVWSITYVECLEWVRPFVDEILSLPWRRDVLQVNLHITRGTVDLASASGKVKMWKGRCDIQKTIDEVFLDRVGSMAVTVCGPGSFSDDVRHAVRKRVELGHIDFVEEAFTY